MSEYEVQAIEFLKKAETKMHISRAGEVKGFPFNQSDTLWHYKYLITLTRKGKQYRFPFYDSNYNWKHNKRPSCYEVLACVEKYDQPDDLEEFAREFCYPMDTVHEMKLVKKIWEGCKKQYERLLDLFGEELLEELREIN